MKKTYNIPSMNVVRLGAHALLADSTYTVNDFKGSESETLGDTPPASQVKEQTNYNVWDEDWNK